MKTSFLSVLALAGLGVPVAQAREVGPARDKMIFDNGSVEIAKAPAIGGTKEKFRVGPGALLAPPAKDIKDTDPGAGVRIGADDENPNAHGGNPNAGGANAGDKGKKDKECPEQSPAINDPCAFEGECPYETITCCDGSKHPRYIATCENKIALGFHVDACEEITCEGEGSAEMQISFYCDLQIDFFKGEGHEPSPEDVKELIRKTDDWLTELFGIDPAFMEYSIEEDVSTVYDAETPDYFYLQFASDVNITADGELMITGIQDIGVMVSNTDYELYITHFLWKTLPLEENQFYQTQEVTLGCYHGARPAASEASRRRRLRGATTVDFAFGGSHRVADRDL